MNDARSKLITSLTEDLKPVRKFRSRDGLAIVALSALITFPIGLLLNGWWIDGLSADASPFFWITSGLLLLLGIATASTVVAMASPSVGQRHTAPAWAAAMVGVLPFAALINIASRPEGLAVLDDGYMLHCVSSSLYASILTAGALVLWLRRGAPVSLNLSGWLTGLAAGAIGSAIYGFSCPVDTIAHLGIWHVVPLVVAAVIGRLIVPKLVEW